MSRWNTREADEARQEKEQRKRQRREEKQLKRVKARTQSVEPADLPIVPAPPITPCRQRNDNYRILNRIQEGTYGVVFRGEDIHTGRTVALKKLKDTKTEVGFCMSGLRELSALNETRHPNIVRLIEVVTHTDSIYMVMEFVEHDLKQLLDQMQHPLSLSLVKTILQQLFAAVGAIHDNWMVHRDLKPSNLLLDNHGMIRVADFGLCRKIGPDMTAQVVTRWYRAPELCLKSTVYDNTVDMWSIGCIFAEVIEKAPFLPAHSDAKQLDLILETVAVPTTQSWPGFWDLPGAKYIKLPAEQPRSLHARFPRLPTLGIDLLQQLVDLNPSRRISCSEAAEHAFFREEPLPKPPHMFPSFPSLAERDMTG